MLRRRVRVVERVPVGNARLVTPIGVFATNHMTPVNAFVLEGELTVLKLLVDATVEEPFVPSAFDPYGHFAIDVYRRYRRQFQLLRKQHAEMRISQLVRPVRGRVRGTGQPRKKLCRQFGPGGLELVAEKGWIVTGAISQFL